MSQYRVQRIKFEKRWDGLLGISFKDKSAQLCDLNINGYSARSHNSPRLLLSYYHNDKMYKYTGYYVNW